MLLSLVYYYYYHYYYYYCCYYYPYPLPYYFYFYRELHKCFLHGLKSENSVFFCSFTVNVHVLFMFCPCFEIFFIVITNVHFNSHVIKIRQPHQVTLVCRWESNVELPTTEMEDPVANSA